MQVNCDVLVIGSGLSGLINAIELANQGHNVFVSSKEAVTETSSTYAQGGIAVPLHSDDSVKQHVQDTIKIGQGLVDEEVAEYFISRINNYIQVLEDWGVPFEDTSNPELLVKEAGHSHKRILRVGNSGLSGRLLMKTLWQLASRHPNIFIAQGNILVELLQNSQKQCIGGMFLDINTNLFPVLAKYTVLATGGYAQIYSRSTNPIINTGDGIALAHRIGAKVSHMDLMQFHPTALDYNSYKYFLLSEALRGEGAQLIDQNNNRIMSKYQPDTMELSSRSQISQAIFQEEQKNNTIYLDCTAIDKELLLKKFKGLYVSCLDLGHDITEKPVPITTVAHYSIGGISTTPQGITNIDNLWAIGETTNTGFHGKDRLASNSLLECIVMGFESAKNIQDSPAITDFEFTSKEEYNVESTYYLPPDLNIESSIAEIKAKTWETLSFKRDRVKIQEFKQELLAKQEYLNTNYKHLTDMNVNQYRTLIETVLLVIRDCL